MKKVVVFIDTSASDSIRVGIEKDGKTVEKVAERKSQAQMVLPVVEELLKSQKLKLSDITEIKVHTGPGSYTGLRVGLAIANMLGFLLGVSINGLPVGKQVFPVYEGDRYKS